MIYFGAGHFEEFLIMHTRDNEWKQQTGLPFLFRQVYVVSLAGSFQFLWNIGSIIKYLDLIPDTKYAKLS